MSTSSPDNSQRKRCTHAIPNSLITILFSALIENASRTNLLHAGLFNSAIEATDSYTVTAIYPDEVFFVMKEICDA